jgi:isoquinoline 1-oxidoreductase beta subunit
MRNIVIPRRSFLLGLGLAVSALAVGLDPAEAEAALTPLPVDGGLTSSVFVHVAPSGLVSIVCHRSEMGQGIRSSLPVLIADEMGADMARVKILQGDGDPAYGDQNTDGSTSVRRIYEAMRRVGATARVMLVGAAAERWHVAPETCEARDHAVLHAASGRKLGFGELAAEAGKRAVPKPSEVTLRPRAELRHVGTSLPLLDGPDMVTGRARYGADVKLPGMLIAVVARPPVVGGKMARCEAARALAIPGVKRVMELLAPAPPFAFQPLGGVAVLAENTWAALRGRAALEITWAHGDNASYESGKYREALAAAVRAPGQVVRKVGDTGAALASAARRLEAEYHVPHLAHAAMEPPAAVARVDAHGCEVWTSTQNPQSARTEVARALGIDASRVVVHVTFLGGGFGRKSKPDYVVEAALLARQAGVPVRVQWTREDDIQHGYYHTTSAQRLEAGLDARGKVTAWLHRAAFPSITSTFKAGVTHAGEGELQQGMLDFPLAVPNVQGENGEARAHLRIGWMRSVCNIHHAFAIGSFIDEIAHARGEDPRDVLLEVIGPARKVTPAELGVDKLPNYGQPLAQHPVDAGRLRYVVEQVTALSDWAGRKKAGRSLGLAAHRSFLTYTAVVVSAVLDGRGKVHVDEAWYVVDAGTVINVDRVRSQMEGAIVFGMSLALHGAITARDGAVEQTNFRDYPVVRIGEAPRAIHVEIVPGDGPPGGIGEPGVPPVAPAIANAVFALTGKRVRELPMVRAGVV